MIDGYVSGSRLQRTAACAGSAALDTIGRESDKADFGSAFHDHNRDRTLMTPGDAMRKLPEHAAAWNLDEVAASVLAARARNWEWYPPPGTMGEVALGLFEDGAVEIVKGARGDYTAARPGMRVATRIDFFWAEPDPLIPVPGKAPRCPPTSLLWGTDLKTGLETWVSAVERNLQALCSAVLPALWTGARAAVPAIVFPTKGQGTWDVPDQPLDHAAILRGRDLLLDIARRANEQREKAARGEALDLVEGPHCQWCDAAARCPAKLATLKSYLLNPRPFDGVELTDYEARRLAELAPLFTRFAESVPEALERHVKARGRPIDLGDGTAWGPHLVPRNRIDPTIAERAMIPVVGETRAKAAIKREISHKAIREAVKAVHDAAGVERQVAPVMRSIFREIIAEGGIVQETQTWWSRYRPERPAAQLVAGAVPMPLGAEGEVEIDGDPLEGES